jgi:hypothetical protein
MKSINKSGIKLEHYKIQRKRARARSWYENQDA